MELWFLLIPIAALVVWALRPAKPMHNELPTPESARVAFEALLRQGVDGGRLTIYVRDRPHQRLVFTKYIRAPGDVGMRSTSALEPDSEVPYQALQKELTERGIAFTEKSDAAGERAIVIDYGRDIGLAQLVTRLVLGGVFKARLETDCLAFTEKVLVRNIPRVTGVDH